MNFEARPSVSLTKRLEEVGVHFLRSRAGNFSAGAKMMKKYFLYDKLKVVRYEGKELRPCLAKRGRWNKAE
jgi:hypothetical protein